VADIVMTELDKDFKYEVASRPGASFFKRCFSCGTCTASCPVSEIDERFNPRLFIRQALLGEKKNCSPQNCCGTAPSATPALPAVLRTYVSPTLWRCCGTWLLNRDTYRRICGRE